MNPNLTPDQRAMYGIYPGMFLGVILVVYLCVTPNWFSPFMEHHGVIGPLLAFLVPVIACMLIMGSPLMENSIFAAIVTVIVLISMVIYLGWAVVAVVGLVGGVAACNK